MASFGENKEEEHDPQFAPVHQLTEKDQIETKTHEEDENVEFKMRAKLFRFESTTNEWKERGTGDVRILAHKETKKVRLVMRRDKTLKVCANHYITSDMRLQPNIGSDRSWVWKVAADVSEGAPTAETLAIRFANSDNAGQFKTAFETAQRTNAELAAGAATTPAASEPTPETTSDDAAPTSTTDDATKNEVAETSAPATDTVTDTPTQDTETKAEETETPKPEPVTDVETKTSEEPADAEADDETKPGEDADEAKPEDDVEKKED